jgi:hypothetical protein
MFAAQVPRLNPLPKLFRKEYLVNCRRQTSSVEPLTFDTWEHKTDDRYMEPVLYKCPLL